MLAFDDKSQEEVRVYTLTFANDLPTGATIASAVVEALVHPSSDVDDASPSSILDGSPSINSEAVTVNAVSYAAGTCISQRVRDGELGCIYVLRYKATLSTGEIFEEDVSLKVIKFVPGE